MESEAEQIAAILDAQTYRWASRQLPAGENMDQRRYRDFIGVTHDDVYDYVVSHGFVPRVVAVGRVWAENQICMVPRDDGRWDVYYTERGERTDEVTVASEAAARHEIVARLMCSARIALNHRYRYAHPDEGLPLPSEMD